MQSLGSLFSHSPSFNRTCSSSSGNNKPTGKFLLQEAFIKDDADQLVSSNNQQEQQHWNDGSEDEFEFAFASVLSPVPADQIFYNGQIRPLYPHFNLEKKSTVSCMIPSAARLPLRKLLVQERELDTSASSCSSSVTDELEGVEAETYSIWDSKTADDSRKLCNKNIRRRKLRDFLQKSKSSGNNSFAFLKYS